MPDHAQDELTVFRSFAQAAPLRIEPDSIEKRHPPAPDIACRTVDGRALAFELVEIVDSDLARADSLQRKLEARFRAATEEDREFGRRFSDAFLAMDFQDHLSMEARRRSIPRIIGFLAALPEGFSGDIPVTTSELASDLRRLAVLRGDFPGPQFYVGACGAFGDPTLPTIQQKLACTYQTDGELALLAYFIGQPMEVGTEWRPGLEDQIRYLLKDSAYSAVWLFEWSSRRVVEIRRAEGGATA